MSDPGSVERFYGRWAALYDMLATRTPGIGEVRERTVDALALSSGDTVVEMGCGTGANFPHIRDRVGEAGQVVGVDLTPGVLSRARRRIDRAGWENVHVVRGDATQPPIERADAVLGTFVVGMFEDSTSAVAGWAGRVEPGGRIALLDAVPRDSPTGTLDVAFRAFVALSAPPTWQVRYEESPARLLRERVERARGELSGRGNVVADHRFGLDFLHLTGVEIE